MSLLHRMPIKYQLRLIVMIMALPVVGLIIHSGIRQRTEAMNSAAMETRKLADRIAYEQQNKIASARQLMMALSQLSEVKQQDAIKVTPLLGEILKLNPEVSNIFIADLSGTVWATAVPVKGPFIVADRRYFKNALKSGELSSGEYVVSRAINRPTFNFSYPIKDINGTVTGVISVGFLLEKYAQILERSRLPHSASFALLDHKGVTLYRGVEPEKYIGKPTDSQLFQLIQEGPDEMTARGVSVASGDERIITTRKFRLESEATPYMYIRAGIPVESVLSDANTQLLRNLTFLSLVLGVAYFFSSFIGTSSIVSRIELLEKASLRLSDGDHQAPVATLVKGGELGRLAVSFDSMAQKLAQREDALLKSMQFSDSVINSLPGIFYVLDRDGRIIRVNDKFYEITGYLPHEVSTMALQELFGEDEKKGVSERIHEVFEQGSSFVEAELRNKEGVSTPYYLTGQLSVIDDAPLLIGMGIDITEIRRAKEGLRDSETRYRHIIENAPIGVFKKELAGKYHYVSPVLVQQFECASEEEFYAHYSPVMDRWGSPEKYDEFIGLLLKNNKVLGHEVTVQLKNDTVKTLSLYAFLDAPHGMINGFALDVTDRKRAEAEQQQLEKQLLHAQKLESLGVLAGGIAHDFNNILMAIIGNADLALMRINKESPATENLHRIEQAAARAADLAKQMLAYSGKGKFVVENIDLNNLLEDMLHMLEVSISKKAVLRLNLHPHLPLVEADATQIRQIVMNLVINSSEAIGDRSGVIAITTGCMDCDKQYLKDVWLDEHITAGLYVFLEVADSGCGMDKSVMAKLFDPFFTTKFTGRGLGMAAVLGIVRGHKGAIKVYSEPKKGTTFKVLLPASGKPAELFNGVSAGDGWTGCGTVLLVDDEESVRGIGREMLSELGFSTITANDGREAVEIYKANPHITFVILDLTMPHMDGEQCFRELLRINPALNVIMSSGFNEQEVTQKFVGKGLAGFIQKPYKMSVLSEVIRSLGVCRT